MKIPKNKNSYWSWTFIKSCLSKAISEDKCMPQWEIEAIRNSQIDNINGNTFKFWVCDEAQTAPEWLDIIWKGKMVEINGKGQIRGKKTT